MNLKKILCGTLGASLLLSSTACSAAAAEAVFPKNAACRISLPCPAHKKPAKAAKTAFAGCFLCGRQMITVQF